MSPRRNWDSPTLYLASECDPSPRTKGEGVGESQFRRLEKKLSTLPTLWYTACRNPPSALINQCFQSWRCTCTISDLFFWHSWRKLIYIQYKYCLWLGLVHDASKVSLDKWPHVALLSCMVRFVSGVLPVEVSGASYRCLMPLWDVWCSLVVSNASWEMSDASWKVSDASLEVCSLECAL